jgi:peptidoglycan-associated lipoprotein
MNRSHVIALASILAAVVVAGCTPDYPNCETDKNCSAKNEFCVAGKCQQCRSSSDCKEGMACNSGRCDKIAGYCQNRSQCPGGQECVANRCGPCGSDKDCTPGSKCWNGVCDSKKHCAKEDDCAQNEDCVKGVCVTEKVVPPAPVKCTLGSVYFDFNESALTTEATGTLSKNADCLKLVARPTTIVGHADPRGTAEYNIALSERRAQSVREHMSRLGVDAGRMAILPRGSLDARGTNEPGWAQDRRADFTWR